MTKVCTHGRDKKMAMQQLEQSLSGLGPIIWMSGKSTSASIGMIRNGTSRTDGVIDALDEAKKAGQSPLRRFHRPQTSRHSSGMLSHDYPFDTVQMPLNCFDATYRSFEKNAPGVIRRGMARWA